MINILERYIVKTIFLATCLSGLIMSVVLLLMTLLAEIKALGKGDYGISHAIFYVLLRLPNEIYQFSPMVILLGSIIGLSVLSTHRELVVMRAAGFSIRSISSSVLFAAFILTLIMSFMGELIGPDLSYKAAVRKENAINAGEAVVTARGVWSHIDNNFIHVERVVSRGLFEGITRYQFDDKHHLQEAYFAKTLSYQNHAWQMNDVVKTTFYYERTKSQTFLHAPWNLKLNTNLFVGLVEPKEMSLSRLAKFAYYLKKNGLQASEYQYDFWQRIFQPIASLVMILLAIPFVLGTSQTETLGLRMIFGIMIGLVFYILNAFLGQLCIVYQIPTMFAALVPPLIFIFVGMVLSNRLVKR